MTSQVSIGRQMNEELKVFSNEKLMEIIRKRIYDDSTIYLKVDVKVKEDPCIDDEFVHVLHYNFNITGHERADCGPRENRNISFSYHELDIDEDEDKPKINFYDNGSCFFDDYQLMNSHSDIYKLLLLKKYALLSFIYEYRNNFNLSKESSDEILNQLENVESHLFFKFFKNVKEDINTDKDFKEFLYIILGKSINSIIYSSYHTALNWTTMKEEKIEPILEPKSEEEINKELDSDLKKYCLKPEKYQDIDSKLEALGLKLKKPK